MPQVINTNIASLNAQRNLNKSQGALNTSLQRLSSGMRINSAKDDAAGLAISERFTAQIRGLNQAVRNSNDGISLAQTAEGALGEVTNNLQRVRELAVQSANATNSASDRAAMQQEVSQLISEIDRVAGQTNFNGVKLLDGSFSSQSFQVGANVGETIAISTIIDATKAGLGLDTGSASASSTAVGAANLLEGDLTINGVDVGAVDADAADIAAAINATGSNVEAIASNVQTIAYTNVVGTALVSTASTAGTNMTDIATATAASAITVGGTTIATVALGGALTEAGADTQINTAFASGGAATLAGYTKTGSLTTGDLVISKTDGSSMTIAATGDMTAALSGLTGTTTGTPRVAANFSMTLDGTAVDLTAALAGSDAAVTGAEMATAISAISGFSATFSGGNLSITKADGSNFVIAESGTDAAGAEGFAGTGTTYRGTVAVTSNGEDLVIGGTDATKAGFTAGTTAADGNGLSVSTVAGANALIESVDRALDTVNGARATLGAVQNRFESVVTSLQTSSESLSAARSRIQDTDFAAETATLTKAQILQQAGMAMMAQANSLPQSVLSLLQ